MSDRVVVAARPRLLTRSFGALLVAQACFGYAFSSFFLLPKFLATELGAGPSEVGFVTAVYGVVVVLCMPAVGAVVDRFGRRDFLTLGAFTMAVASFAFVTVETLGPLVYVLRAVQGLAFAMAFVGGATLAVDEAPPERLGQAIGLFGLTFLAMNAVATATIEEVAERAGWAVAFATPAAAAGLSCALSRLIRERRRPPAGGDDVPGLWGVVSRPSQLRIMAVIALVGAAMGSLFTFHQLFAIELGIAQVRSFFVAYTAAAISVRVGLGGLLDRAGRRRVSILALVLYVPVVIAMVELDRLGLALLGAGLGVAHGLFYPAFNAVAVEGSREDERGKLMALFQAAFNIGFAGGPLALGLLAERAGYPAVFLTGGACAFAALALLVVSPEGRGSRGGV